VLEDEEEKISETKSLNQEKKHQVVQRPLREKRASTYLQDYVRRA
jgi:hypothetical protein